MLPTPRNYSLYPSIVPADKPVDLIIVPNERAFLLVEGAEYQLTLIAVNGDETSYHSPTSHKHLTATAKDGVLRFTYTFPGEGEHLIRLCNEEKCLQELRAYSLYEDLYALTPLKGDFHSHTFRSDGNRDPAAAAGHYREQGYDFYALTDHNRFYPGGEIDEVYKDTKTGFYRVTGEEVHVPGTVVHIVHAGGKESVANQYIHNRDTHNRELADCLNRVPADIPEQYKECYARAMWATEAIHKAGGLAIFAHPYWAPGGSRVYNVNDEFARILLRSGMFDAYELVGGMGQAGVNRSVAMWSELRAEGHNIPVVGSSDVHGMEKASTFPFYFTICFAEKKENDSIIASVKSGNSVAVEMNGYEYDKQYRCYGSLRLVSYAQFLLRYYFPNHERICQGEGVAMRSYAMGMADAQLVNLIAEQAENDQLRFFGRKAPVLPSQEILDFEAKWRERHLTEGPHTKGSDVDAPKITRQI